MAGRNPRRYNLILRCPECSEEWTSRAEKHREEWGWDIQIEEEKCSVCGVTGRVIDYEDDRYAAADMAYDRWVEERMERGTNDGY